MEQKQINHIITILENRDGRYYGFRYQRGSDGATISAQISGGESNVLNALGRDEKGAWRNDYTHSTVQVKEKELFALPDAGCTPGEIRAWVEKMLDKKEHLSQGTKTKEFFPIYDAAKAAGVQIDSHESDLYLPVNDTTKDLVSKFVASGGAQPSTFTNQVDKKQWFDIFGQYLPFWRKVQERVTEAKAKLGHGEDDAEETSIKV